MKKRNVTRAETANAPQSLGGISPWAEHFKSTGIPELILAAATDPSEVRVDGGNNLTHAEGVARILVANTSIDMTPPLETAIMMHDVILPRSNRAEKREEQEHGMRFGPVADAVMDKLVLYHSGMVSPDTSPATRSSIPARRVKTNEMLYALGVAVSANMWEFAGEDWRRLIINSFSQDGVNPDLEFLEKHLEQVATGHGISIEDLKHDIHNALISGKAPVTEAMLEFRAPMLDLTSILNEFGRSYDLEGLVIKAAEVIYNTSPDHRNINRPASTWRDAQELISLYGPLLEFLGFEDLAALAYGTANEYFFQKSKFMPRAQDVHDRAQFYWSQETRTKVLSGLHTIPGVAVLSDRVKHVGSIVAKLNEGRGTPDVVGLRLKIDEPKTPDLLEKHVWNYVDNITSQMRANGFELGDIRGGNPVEIRWEGLAKGSGRKRRNNGDTFHFETKGPTIDGYEGMHLSFFKLDDPEIGLEVQVFTSRQNEIRTGISSHGFYKAANAIGELGQARREYDRVEAQKTEMDEVAKLEGHFRRRNYFIKRGELLSLLRQFKLRINRFAGPS